MRCVCGQQVLQVVSSSATAPRLLDADRDHCGIWTVDQAGYTRRLTVKEIWGGVRGHLAHECAAQDTDGETLFEVLP